MKLVRENARPIGADSGLKEIRLLAESGNFNEVTPKAKLKNTIFCLNISII
jgi:phosphomannomutase